MANDTLDEFDEDNSILRTYIHLNKLIEATHLIEIRLRPATPKPKRKWERGKVKKTDRYIVKQ